MFNLAVEWDNEQERLENKLILEKQSTANAEAVAQLTQDSLDFANGEIKALAGRISGLETLKDYYKRQADYHLGRMKAFISVKHALLNRGLISRILNREPQED
jgi:hypothetical protein